MSVVHFSPRQDEVLGLIADGLTDKEIAMRLGLRKRTVRTYLERLYARHGVHNRAGAVTIWLRAQDRMPAQVKTQASLLFDPERSRNR